MTTGRVVEDYACRLVADQASTNREAYGQNPEDDQERWKKQAYRRSLSLQKQYAYR
jgi:hypothetical protein